MRPRQFCEQGLREIRAGTAGWARGIDGSLAADLLAEAAAREPSGYEFAWYLWRAALQADADRDPGRAAAARAALRAWQRVPEASPQGNLA